MLIIYFLAGKSAVYYILPSNFHKPYYRGHGNEVEYDFLPFYGIIMVM